MILLIGHGYWGKNIAKTLHKDLYAVCDLSQEVLEEISFKYPHTLCYNNIEDALANDNITAVIIATKAATHFDIAKKVISTGRDLWIEKPACVTLDETNKLVELAEEKNVQIFVDHIMCYDSTIKHLKNTIDLSDPVYFESYRLHQGLYQPDTDVIYDLATHDLSIIDYLFPEIKLVKKEIVKNNHVNKFADHAVLNFTFDNGLRATIICSWVSPVKQRQILIHCNNTMIDLQGSTINCKTIEKLDETYSVNSFINETVIDVEQQPGLETAICAFKKMINKEEIPVTNIYQAKRIQEWIEQ